MSHKQERNYSAPPRETPVQGKGCESAGVNDYFRIPPRSPSNLVMTEFLPITNPHLSYQTVGQAKEERRTQQKVYCYIPPDRRVALGLADCKSAIQNRATS